MSWESQKGLKIFRFIIKGGIDLSYIYKITNNVNNKVYIGKTSLSSIEQRFQQHVRDSRKIQQQKRPLYDAMNKYGISNFSIELIEQVPNDEIASQREQFWIKEFRSYVGFKDCNGYNATLGGDSKHYYNYQEIAKKFIELNKNQLATARFFDCDIETVRKACEEFKEITGYSYDYRHTKMIKRINLQTLEEKIYNSVTEAGYDIPNKEPQTARKNISRAINKGSTAYGYKWILI